MMLRQKRRHWRKSTNLKMKQISWRCLIQGHSLSCYDLIYHLFYFLFCNMYWILYEKTMMPVGNFLDVLGPPAVGLQRLSKLGGVHTWSSGASSAAYHTISSTGFITLTPHTNYIKGKFGFQPQVPKVLQKKIKLPESGWHVIVVLTLNEIGSRTRTLEKVLELSTLVTSVMLF